MEQSEQFVSGPMGEDIQMNLILWARRIDFWEDLTSCLIRHVSEF